MEVILSENLGEYGALYGDCQMPVKLFLEKRGEAFEQETILKKLFKMYESDNFGDTFTGMGGMGGFKPVGENGSYPNDGMKMGYEKQIRYKTWKDQFAISAEMIEDGHLVNFEQAPAAFMQGYGRTREQFGASLYANAMMGKTSMKYAGGTFDIAGADGKALFAPNHQLKHTKTTMANMFKDAFSVEALDMAETAMHLFEGDDGQILDVAPSTILIPDNAALKREVFAAIGADKHPDTSNNGFNYQFGRWNVIVWSYLNKFLAKGLKPWVLLDQSFNELYGGALFGDRKKLVVRSVIDEDTDANVWKGRSRFNATGNDWRFACVGGMPDGVELSTLNL
jgi:hypothetical protein